MTMTKSYTWKHTPTDQRLLSLVIPADATKPPHVDVHACSISLEEAGALAEAAQAALQLGAGFHVTAPSHAQN
jgi:hypothetical protein